MNLIAKKDRKYMLLVIQLLMPLKLQLEKITHTTTRMAKDSRLIIITAHRRENLGKPMVYVYRYMYYDESTMLRRFIHSYESKSS